PPGTVPGRFIRRRYDRAILASLVALAALGFLTLCYVASSVFITIISSILIAFALEPLVQLLCRRARLGRIASSVIVVFLAMGVLYAILYLAYGSAQQLFADLPVLVEEIRNSPTVDRITSHVYRLTETLQEAGRTIAPPAPSPPAKETAIILRDSTSWAETIFRGLGSLTTILFSLSFIPFLVYFLLAEKEHLVRRTRLLFPEEHRETVSATIFAIERMLQKFLTGNAIVAGILSVATALVFFLVGLPYWLALGIVSGIVSTIPYLGLILALLPPLIVGLITFTSGTPVVVIVACVSGFHVVAANFLIPKLVGKGVQLNPVAATVSIMFFGWMWGGMGLILGIPIVAVAKVVLEHMEPTRELGLWLGD
ncbi:MAG TPA: AI-2E family transporter, partial [Candidatus Limnocylindrales bacterium]|nr:AI-2E family transporter [Candidatus Limnocylindrales bacterium]